jgi:hypothetical protein
MFCVFSIKNNFVRGTTTPVLYEIEEPAVNKTQHQIPRGAEGHWMSDVGVVVSLITQRLQRFASL